VVDLFDAIRDGGDVGLYLVAIERRPERADPTGKINAWKTILNPLTSHYGDRVTSTSDPAHSGYTINPSVIVSPPALSLRVTAGIRRSAVTVQIRGRGLLSDLSRRAWDRQVRSCLEGSLSNSTRI
jgi:hypothetical protein